jgi:hypothetical protein
MQLSEAAGRAVASLEAPGLDPRTMNRSFFERVIKVSGGDSEKTTVSEE